MTDGVQGAEFGLQQGTLTPVTDQQQQQEGSDVQPNEPTTGSVNDGATGDAAAAPDASADAGDAGEQPDPLDGLGEVAEGCKRWRLTYANGAEEVVITTAQTAAEQCNATFGLTEEEAAERGCAVTEA